MENSPRIETVMTQLKRFHPTNRVYIVVNKGFRKCKKELPKQNSMYDIIHANFFIFKHANSQGYSNILILEDDFQFSEKIMEASVQQNVNTFISQRKDSHLMYLLGCLPLITVPYTTHTSFSLWSLGMHAVVYSKSFRTYLLDYSKTTTLSDWDTEVTVQALLKRCKFTYKVPLCNQTFPRTENRDNWNMNSLFRYCSDSYIALTKFDKAPEPGTSILYAISFLISFSLFFGLLILLLKGIVFALDKFPAGSLFRGAARRRGRA
jgi:hypothetical protein